MLIAESLTPAQVDPYGCKVLAGDWLSVYDGIAIDQPGDLDIDHVVALAEAWDSGASGWDLARRRAFRTALETCGGSLIASPPVPAPTTTSTTATTPPPSASPPGGSDITLAALDCGGERVTVVHHGSVPVELSGWTIHDEGTKHTFRFPDGYQLSGGASVTVASGGAAGAGDLHWTGASVWNNDGDTAFLIDPRGTVQSTRSC